MSDANPTLLLTRPQTASEKFLRDLERVLDRRVAAVISPIMQIVDFGELPDVSTVETIIVTSAHSVRRLGRAGELDGRRVAAVGQVTSDLAKDFGARIVAVGMTADELFERRRDLIAPCLHCRGVHSVGSLASRLSQAGFSTDEVVIYDQLPSPLSPAARRALESEPRVIAPVFSPRSAELLSAEIPDSTSLEVIAISDATKRAWSGPGCVTVAKEPSAHSMLLSVAHAT